MEPQRHEGHEEFWKWLHKRSAHFSFFVIFVVQFLILRLKDDSKITSADRIHHRGTEDTEKKARRIGPLIR